MMIGEIRVLRGPNVYSHQPVLRMLLNLQELTGKESYEVPGFVGRLVHLLPGLGEHHCALGYPGGFIERLHGGTWFSHVVEHVAIELANLAGIPVNHGKTRESPERGWFYVVVEYRAEQGMRRLLETAVRLVEALVRGDRFPLGDEMAAARELITATELGPSTRAIADAAERRNIPWERLNGGSLVRLGWGEHLRYIEATVTSATSAVALEIARDKEMTKKLLGDANVPVPYGVVVQSEEEAAAAFAEMKGVVTVKPVDGSQGRGVSVRLQTAEEVVEAARLVRQFSTHIIVEECFEGRDYRVLVVNGKCVAVSERKPAQVAGDGVHTVRELIERENQDPRRGADHDKPLTVIRIDEQVEACLGRAGLTLEDVAPEGQRVLLRESGNLSTGGTARDATGEIHPQVARMCERAARVIGLDVCGVDLITPDISRPLAARAGIVEVNAGPGIRMHHYPSAGEPRDAGGAIIQSLFPSSSDGRIPLISITGTNGKTTTTRMIGHIAGGTGKIAGMATTDGIYIGEERFARGDLTGPKSARTVLADPAVQVAVLETARGGIIRNGLGYDWADVGIITNIQADHIGQDGIQTLEDIEHVKSLVAERVRRGGTLILNADDERLARWKEIPRIWSVPKKLVYYALQGGRGLLREHLASGETAYFTRNGWIVEACATSERAIVELSDVPLTLGGLAEFQVYNTLAAVAGCRALGIPASVIRDRLRTFESASHNAGRANLFRAGAGYVMIDYGHNPAAFEAICRTAAQWNGRRVTGVIGVPGDRCDALIEAAGRAAARGFDRIILREDADLRGRGPGEVIRILERAIREERPAIRLDLIPNEREAVLSGVREMQQDEIIVAFCEEPESASAMLIEHGATPTDRVEIDLSQHTFVA